MPNTQSSVDAAVERAASIARTGAQLKRDVKVYCANHDITVKRFAELADVNYYTLVDVMSCRTAGHELVPKVRAFMEKTG